ncbi:MAG: recombinase family protein, partial [Patescibacteria group bacterium]
QKGIRAYMNGRYSLSELAKETSEWGLRTRTDKPMTKQLWERILKNKFYAGIIVSPWTGQESQGQHQPLITLEEYNQIQLVKKGFSRNALAPRLHIHPDFPLRGFVLCTCGRKLSASWRQGRSKKYPRYHCFNRNCQHYTHSIDKFDLEDKFKEFLTSITPKENYLKLFEETVLGTWKGNYTMDKQERIYYEGQLKKLEDQSEQLIRMRMKQEISKEDFLKLKDNLDNQITGIYISRNEAKISEFDFGAAVTYAVNFARNITRLWQEADDDVRRKQRLQKLVLPKGIIYDKNTGEFGTAVLSQIFKLSEEFDGNASNLVAGIGIAPMAGGYEPPEILLLHPAIFK